MRNILVDTDVLINFLRGKERARDFLASIVSESVLYVSVITVAELHAGALPHEAERTQALLDGLTIVDVTRDIAEKAGSYKLPPKASVWNSWTVSLPPPLTPPGPPWPRAT